jgi:hypothetical protein
LCKRLIIDNILGALASKILSTFLILKSHKMTKNNKLKLNNFNNNSQLISNKNTPQFSKELLDDLMKDYNPNNPEGLIGRDGLPNYFRKEPINHY